MIASLKNNSQSYIVLLVFYEFDKTQAFHTEGFSAINIFSLVTSLSHNVFYILFCTLHFAFQISVSAKKIQ